jgi:penicillin-binding protein 1A
MDKWFVGYTSYYVGAVWSGRDVNEKNDRGLSTNISASLWKKVMEKVHDGYENKEIEISEGMVSTKVCSVTGNLATSKCPGINQYYARGEQPKKYCSGKHSIPSSEPDENTEEIIIDDENAENSNSSDTTSSTQTENSSDSSASTDQDRENTTPSTSTDTGSESTSDDNGTDNTPNRRPSSVVAD